MRFGDDAEALPTLCHIEKVMFHPDCDAINS